MPFTILFDSSASITRVLDSDLPLSSQSLLPLQGENQLVPNQLRQRAEHRGRGDRRQRRDQLNYVALGSPSVDRVSKKL
jgi:hypothetical protein